MLAGAHKFFLAIVRSAVMVQLLVAFFLLSPTLAGGLSLQQDQTAHTAEDEIGAGVVVGKVAPYSEAEKAGIKEGDVLLSWSRGDSKGVIHSPFDVTGIFVEEAPLGLVKLEGLRGTEKQIWSLVQSDWGLTTRPNFSGRLLSDFREGEELAKGGKNDGAVQAAERWKDLANRYSGSHATWLAAWLYFHAGERLREVRQWKEADDAYRSAVQSASVAVPSIEIGLLQAWAEAYEQRSDWTNAEKCFQESIAKIKSSGNNELAVASVLNALGTISRQRGELNKAEQYHRQSLDLRQKLSPGSLAVASSFNNLGIDTGQQGDLAKAEEYFGRALEITEKLAPRSLGVASSLANLAIVAINRGDLANAEKYSGRALEIEEKLAPGSMVIAASLTNLGIVALTRGDLVKAEEYLRKALEIEEKLAPGGLAVAANLNNLANIAAERGDLAKAEKYLRQALQIRQKLAPRSLDVATTYGSLANVARKQGDLANAEKYFGRALEIEEKLAPGSLDVAKTYSNLAIIARIRGDLAKAEEYNRQALEIQKKLAPGSSDIAAGFDNLGNIAYDRGDLAKAEKYYSQALEITEKLAPKTLDHAKILTVLARIARRLHKLEAAAELYKQALNALEGQTTTLGGVEEVRAGFRADHSSIYKEYVDLLLAQKQPTLAFEVLERSRARGLLEMLTAAHIDIHKGADPSLLEQEHSLRELLAVKSDRRLRLLGDTKNEKQVAVFTQEIAELEKQYQEVEERLRLNSPAYAALTQLQPLSTDEIQHLLDADSMLVEYSLGEKRSHVFVVTPSSVKFYELPPEAEIESAAKAIYKYFGSRNALRPRETGFQRQTRLNLTEAEYTVAAKKLSQMVLAPVTEQIKGKRLLIVGDGALQYVPFAALPSPESNTGPREPLLAKHEIVNLPSASILSVLRREASLRKPTSKAVIVLADPVFDQHDDRFGSSLKTVDLRTNLSQGALEFSLDRSAHEVGTARNGVFPRLPFSRREAKSIDSVAKPGDVTEALDFDASKAKAMSQEMRNYRIVHLATHGLVNSEHPELSGLVFSLFDSKGKSQDGFLRLSDIYNLELNADLVVLSACQTALGKQINGEGLIGITRGFMYAGSARVVASLWNVDDEATAELMKKFYEGMLKNDRTPAESLRAAQMWMRNQKRWKAPYYWAGFILLGEWK
jgi:CHAT domain-containing protein/tetratricopeptide (TPR) repeat protein